MSVVRFAMVVMVMVRMVGVGSSNAAHRTVGVQALEELRSSGLVMCEQTVGAFLEVGTERNSVDDDARHYFFNSGRCEV